LARSETFAIRISNFANMILFVAKVYASVRSGSLAIIASTLDSLLDLLSGFILWFTAFSMQTPSPYQYPIGKRRMQPLVSHLPIILCDSQVYMLKFTDDKCSNDATQVYGKIDYYAFACMSNVACSIHVASLSLCN
jgi:hypothetical protein